MAAALLPYLALSTLLLAVAAVQKSERRQDYGDYGGDDAFLTADVGAAGYAFAESFGGGREKDPFAAVYGGPGSDEGDEELYSAFAYDAGGEDDVYAEYDVDYEGSEKKEKKQKQDRKGEVKRKDGPKAAPTKPAPEAKKQERGKKAPSRR